jgi:hypothetical protein
MATAPMTSSTSLTSTTDDDSILIRPVDSGPKFLQIIQKMILVLLVLGLGTLYWPLFFMGSFGYADKVYLTLYEYRTFFWGLFLGTTSLMLLLVLFDVGFWKGFMWYVGRLLMGLVVLGYALTALVCTHEFPAAPIIVYLCTTPIVVYTVKISVLQQMSNHTMVFYLAFSLFIVASVSGLAWLIWCIPDNYWNDNEKWLFYTRLNCTSEQAIPFNSPNRTLLLKEIDHLGECNEGFLSWLSPVILCVWAFFQSLMLAFIWRAQENMYQNKKRVDSTTKMFLVFITVALVGLWIASGISGAEASLATDVFAFSMLALLFSVIALTAVSGVDRVKEDIKTFPIVERILGSTESDWFKALIFFIGFPLIFVAVPLSSLRQFGRKYLPFTKTLTDPAERKLWVTQDVYLLYQYTMKWHWTSVTTKGIWWGLIFDTIHVGIEVLLNVFFSWLNDAFVAANLSLTAICIILFAAAWLLIMQPPTPGMPLFLASAIIIVPAGMRSGVEFWSAWALSTFVALLIKQTGLLGAQILGDIWGRNSVSIRRIVGINSMEMRSIKYILKEKGITVGKVAVLLGGPDWPVSVIAGLLKTSYIENQLATLFILAFMVPITLTGAFLIRVPEGGLWASASTMMLGVAIFTQGISMIIAMHYIDITIREKRDVLLGYGTDEAVAKLDEKGEEINRARKFAQRWKHLPQWLKFILCLGFLLSACSAYAFGLFSSRCFVQFEMTEHIGDLPGGNLIGIMKPLGWVAIGFFFAACVALIILGRWVSWVGLKKYPVPTKEEEASGLVSSFSSKQKVDPTKEKDIEDEMEEVYKSRWVRWCSCFRDVAA